MKRLMLFVLLAAASVALPASAAIRANIGVNLSLRAGPDQGYPRITVVPSGVDVVVYGCLGDWSWCDVGFSGHRGWVAGDYLRYDYLGRRVWLPQYATAIGVPVVTFVFTSYWGTHYRNQPWYRERARWERYRPPPRARIQPRRMPPGHVAPSRARPGTNSRGPLPARSPSKRSDGRGRER